MCSLRRFARGPAVCARRLEISKEALVRIHVQANWSTTLQVACKPVPNLANYSLNHTSNAGSAAGPSQARPQRQQRRIRERFGVSRAIDCKGCRGQWRKLPRFLHPKSNPNLTIIEPTYPKSSNKLPHAETPTQPASYLQNAGPTPAINHSNTAQYET